MRVRAVQRGPEWAAALAALACVACLPLGAPPPGRHELHARDIDGLGFIQPAPGKSASLFTRRWSGTYTTPCESHTSLFAVDETASPAATERLIGDDVELAQPNGFPTDEVVRYGLPADARGRVLVARQPPTPAVKTPDGFSTCPPGNGRLTRIDPGTGASTELGELWDLYTVGELSPDQTRFAFSRVGQKDGAPASEIAVRDLDDHETAFIGTAPHFVGSHLYAIDADATLVEVAANGTVIPTLRDVGRFDVLPTARGPLLSVAASVTGQQQPGPARLFDPATASEIVVPEALRGLEATISPSGRYIMFLGGASQGAEVTFALLDRDTGTTESRPWRFGQWNGWRADRDEFWSDVVPTLLRWTPGQPTRVSSIARPASTQFGFASTLSDDGRWWLLYNDSTDIEARSTDDPQTPGFLINPPNTRLDYGPRSLPDGRLLTQAKVGPENRFDIYLVDPGARTRTPLASGGYIVTNGPTRALVMLRWVPTGASGDLSLIDFATGEITTLAENAFRLAVEPVPAGDDPLAPGLRLASLVRNRIASPYDGLWVTTLP